MPTPIKNNLSPDLRIVKKVLNEIKKFLKVGQVLSFESTTYPGTTEEFILPALNKFHVGKNFFLVYSPERDDPGSKLNNKKKFQNLSLDIHQVV